MGQEPIQSRRTWMDDERVEERFKPARTLVYKTASGVDLRMYVFEPPMAAAPAAPRPAVVFFFGGGWTNGDPRQFFPQCAGLADAGMIAASAEYRIRARHSVGIADCVADARAAVRWLRAHAEELGVDPGRIAAGGGSAGAHIAACAGMIDGEDEAGEGTRVSACPDAMILFNPPVDLRPFRREGQPAAELTESEAAHLSPTTHVRPGLPPTILFQGEEDVTTPASEARRFAEMMKSAGNRCDLRLYPGVAHGFFNLGRSQEAFEQTLGEAKEFLKSLGWAK